MYLCYYSCIYELVHCMIWIHFLAKKFPCPSHSLTFDTFITLSRLPPQRRPQPAKRHIPADVIHTRSRARPRSILHEGNRARHNPWKSRGMASSDSDDSDDGLLSGGPIFSSSASAMSVGGISGGGSGFAAAAALRKTLGRLEHLSAACASGKAAQGMGKKRKPAASSASAAARAREVASRKAAREADRDERREAKEAEKFERGRRVRLERQATGKFAPEEVLAWIDSGLAPDGRAATSSSAAVAAAEEPVGLAEWLARSLADRKFRTVTEGDGGVAPGSWVPPRVGAGAACVRWTRRDYVSGGSEGLGGAASDDADVHRSDVVAVVFHDPGAFLGLLKRDASAEARDDYPALREWLGRLRSSLRSGWERRWRSEAGAGGERRGVGGRGWGGTCPSQSRIVLVLHRVQAELQKEWNRGGRRRSSFSPASEEELHDATVWLLMEERVECTLTTTDEETAEFVANLTRALAEAPYYEEPTELHCVKKLKASAALASGDGSAKATDAWMRQAQQIPGISEVMARNLVGRYPTLMSLVEAYEDPDLTEEGRRTLLADCLTGGRTCRAISERMYVLLTSRDPSELL